jgi:SAM-dependent methyltransferase
LTAVDISTRALTRAKERCSKLGNVPFQRLDLNISVVAGLFDLVVCSELLYYFTIFRNQDLSRDQDLRAAIKRILGHVRPGGIFLTAHARLVVDDPEGSGFAWDPHFTFGAETIANGIWEISGGFFNASLSLSPAAQTIVAPRRLDSFALRNVRICFGIWDLRSAVPYAVIAESVLKRAVASACHLCCQVGPFSAELPNCGVGAEE